MTVKIVLASMRGIHPKHPSILFLIQVNPNLTLINQFQDLVRPSKKKKKKKLKKKTSNWSRFNEILQNDFNIEPDSLTKEDKYLCKEF